MDERRVPEALLGAYVATVLVPAAVLSGVEPAASAGPAVLAGVGLAVAVLVALAARVVDDLVDRVATLEATAVTTLPPLGFLPYMLVETSPGSTAAALAAVGLLGVLPGIGVPVAGAAVRSRRARERATERVAVTVGEGGDGGGNYQVAAGLVVMGVLLLGAAAFVTVTDADVETGTTFVTLFGSVSTMVAIYAGDQETELTVTDEGLLVDRSLSYWDTFEGYRVTDDALELVHTRWYLPTREFDREEISDEDALLDGLAEFLPRLDGEGRVRQPAGR
jgi:hypothetical protein